MSRPERWWRPAGQRRNTRPAVRSARRARYAAESDAMHMFELGLEMGVAEEQWQSRQRDEQIRRLAEAAEAAQNGDSSLLDAFVDGDRPASGDDLLDVADAAGVTPLADVDGEQLVDELEAWLHGRDGDG